MSLLGMAATAKVFVETTHTAHGRRSTILRCLLFTAIVGCGIARIEATYKVFTQTFDEPFHIAAGMEWLDKGTYDFEPQHPPLSRIFVALGPYLRGVRSHGKADIKSVTVAEGNAILATNGAYAQNLAVARMGTLPFYALACAVVWLWARRWYGESVAWFSLIIFSSLPAVLAHASLATTDMGATATIALALYSFVLWTERPSWKRALFLAVGLSLAISAKYSAVLFLPLCGMAITAIYIWKGDRGNLRDWASLKQRMKQLTGAAAIALALFWVIMRFDVQPLATMVERHPKFETRMPRGAEVKRFLGRNRWIQVPLTGALEGIGTVLAHNQEGHKSYLFG